MHIPPRTFSLMELEEMSRTGSDGQKSLRPAGRR